MTKTYNAQWTSFEQTTKADWDAVMEYEAQFNAGLVDRLLDQLKLLDEAWTPYPINRYQHCLQSATRAHDDGADDETIVAALLHDIGDIISPYNHSDVAGAMLKPYVSEKTWWIVKHHGVFQGYYFNQHLGGDQHVRDNYKDSPYYDDAVYFCHKYDQCAFDPNYATKPLEFFIPMLRNVFSKATEHAELGERSSNA